MRSKTVYTGIQRIFVSNNGFFVRNSKFGIFPSCSDLLIFAFTFPWIFPTTSPRRKRGT